MNKVSNFRTLLVGIFFLMAFCDSSYGQSPHYTQFSQFYSTPTLLAPSYAGLTGGSRVALNYRDQWPAIPGTFVTYALALDHYFPRIRSGFGIQVLRDQAGAGDLSLTNIGFLYSYDFLVTRKWHVRPGVNFTYSQRSLKFAELTLGDQLILLGENSPTSIEVPPQDHANYIDASASVLGYNDRYWAGLTVDHLMRPNESLKGEIGNIPMRFSLFGGTKIGLGKSRKNLYNENILLAFLYKAQQNSDQLDLGIYWNKNPIVLGAWFRGIPVFLDKTGYGLQNIDAVIVLIGYKLTNFSIGYSFDFTISELMNHTGGTHEVSIIYEFNSSLKLDKRKKYGAVACPEF